MNHWCIIISVCLVFLISCTSRKHITEFYKKDIFHDVIITNEKYESGGIQESSWSGWVEHDPKVLKKKIKDGIWVVSDYFHDRKEYGSGNDFYEGIREFLKIYPSTKHEDLVFMIMDKQTLPRGEVRCVTNKDMTHSFIFAWGNF